MILNNIDKYFVVPKKMKEPNSSKKFIIKEKI